MTMNEQNFYEIGVPYNLNNTFEAKYYSEKNSRSISLKNTLNFKESDYIQKSDNEYYNYLKKNRQV